MSRPKTPISLIQTFASRPSFVTCTGICIIEGEPSTSSFSDRLTLTFSTFTRSVNVFGLTWATPLPAAARVSINFCPDAIRAVRASLPPSVTMDLNFAIRFSSLRCRRVFVPVHCSHSGTSGRFGRLVVLWNIRPQAKNQIRRNHLSQGRRQGVTLGVAFQADSDI